MGYRNKIAIMDTSRHEIIKDMNLEDLKEWFSRETNQEIGEDGYIHIPCYELSKEVHELGKYCDFKIKNRSRIFSNKEVELHFNDEGGEFYFINQDGFQELIEDYRKKILNYYELLLKQDEKDILLGRVTTIEHDLKSKIRQWGENCTRLEIRPYNLNLKSDEIVSAWEYEYAIFELVRVYKSIDWDNQKVAITGW